MRLIRRRPADEPSGEGSAGTTPAGSSDLVRDAHTTAGKGRPTPRRAEAQRRRTGPVPPPPRTRREALRRQRELAQRRPESTARGRAGDEAPLPRRDQGPERRLVRDIVDSRRNASAAFLPTAVLVLVSTFVPSPVVKGIALYVWVLAFALIIFDSVLVGQRVRRLVRERFPKTRESTVRLTLYGVNRTILPRRWRLPAAQASRGDEI